MSDFERELREIRQAKQAQAEAEANRAARARQEAEEAESQRLARARQELIDRLTRDRAFLRSVKPTADRYLQELARATWGHDFGVDFQDYTDPKSHSDFRIATWRIGRQIFHCGKDRKTVVKIGDNKALKKHKGDFFEIQSYSLYLSRRSGTLSWSPGDTEFPADENGLKESVRLLAECGPNNTGIVDPMSGSRWW